MGVSRCAKSMSTSIVPRISILLRVSVNRPTRRLLQRFAEVEIPSLRGLLASPPVEHPQSFWQPLYIAENAWGGVPIRMRKNSQNVGLGCLFWLLFLLRSFLGE
jgi:hypothetical protein